MNRRIPPSVRTSDGLVYVWICASENVVVAPELSHFSFSVFNNLAGHLNLARCQSTHCIVWMFEVGQVSSLRFRVIYIFDLNKWGIHN